MSIRISRILVLVIGIVGLVCRQSATVEAGGDIPFFTCSFESRAELDSLGGKYSSEVKFVSGIKGLAADLRSMSCQFPASRCLPETEGSLSIWFYPYWKLDKETKHRDDLISCRGDEEHFGYNYFSILGHAYGDPSKGDPCNLIMIARKGPDKAKQLLILPDDVSWEKEKWQHIVAVWRINTDRKDGVFMLYLNGELLGRKTDFMADKIDFAEYLTITLNAKIDELKIWDRILSEEEIKEEFSKGGEGLKQ